MQSKTDTFITFRCSPDQREAIDKFASVVGTSRSAFILSTLLAANEVPRGFPYEHEPTQRRFCDIEARLEKLEASELRFLHFDLEALAEVLDEMRPSFQGAVCPNCARPTHQEALDTQGLCFADPEMVLLPRSSKLLGAREAFTLRGGDPDARGDQAGAKIASLDGSKRVTYLTFRTMRGGHDAFGFTVCEDKGKGRGRNARWLYDIGTAPKVPSFVPDFDGLPF